MSIVAGVDFGTLSVRVSIVDSDRGLLATALAEYPLHRKREDPEHATLSHHDQMRALATATREAVKQAGRKPRIKFARNIASLRRIGQRKIFTVRSTPSIKNSISPSASHAAECSATYFPR